MSCACDNPGPKRSTRIGAWSLALLLSCPGLNAYSVLAASSSDTSKPVLKAIDPSQAKMDALPKPPQSQSPSPNPLGGISGAPISADKARGLPPASAPGNWAPSYPPGSGYPAPVYMQPQAAQPAYPPAGYPQQYQSGYPAQTPGYPQQQPSYPQQAYPAQMPTAPPGYPTYPPQQQQQPYGYGQPPQQYGAPPSYGAGQYGSAPAGYGGQPAAPVVSPPGYPSFPPQQQSFNNQLPPGFVQQGGQGGQGNFPAGRARLGGGHPNLVPQGAPQTAGPSAPPGFVANPGYPQQGGGYPQQQPVQQPAYSQPGFNSGYPQQAAGYPPQSGYPQQPAPGGYPQQPAYSQGSPNSQFASTNFPPAGLIPDFGKPLPLDASNRGPATMWTTNQMLPAPGGGAPQGESADEARVTRLEKVAFGSTYPEHEIEDRVDHLEKEIFSHTNSGDMNSRLMQLEVKLGGGGGSFGSPMRSQSAPQYGSYSGGQGTFPVPSISRAQNAIAGTGAQSISTPVAKPPELPVALDAKQLALTQPDNSPSQDGAPVTPQPDSSAASEDDGASQSSPAADDGDSAPGDATMSQEQDSDEDSSASPPSDTTDGVSAPAGKSGSSDLKAMAGSRSAVSAPTTNNSQVSNSIPKIPYDKSAGDYFDRITKFVNNTSARWTSFPIRVRLPDDASAEWRKLMEPSIEKWGKYIPLKKASHEEAADIEVSFVNHLVPRVLGVTRLTVTSGKMKVFIYMLRPNYYPQLAEKTLTAAFLHELGHAIGIFGHSDNPADAMYVFEVATSGQGRLTQEKLGSLSSRDINTLKQIYDSEPLPDDFNMSAPQEWSLLSGESS